MEWLLVVAVVVLLAIDVAVALRRRSAELPEGVTDPSVRAAANRLGGPRDPSAFQGVEFRDTPPRS
jgi:hypothetical protein